MVLNVLCTLAAQFFFGQRESEILGFEHWLAHIQVFTAESKSACMYTPED